MAREFDLTPKRVPRVETPFRRIVTRFWKSYVGRKGYREGATGLMLGLFAALYPIVSYLKARELTEKADRRPK